MLPPCSSSCSGPRLSAWPAVLPGCVADIVRHRRCGRRLSNPRLRWAPEYKPVTSILKLTPVPTINSRSDTPVFISAETSRRTSAPCSTRTTAPTTTPWRYWTRWRNSTHRPCSTSGSAVSFRRATAQTSTARSTPTSGQVYNDGIQDGYPFVFQGRDNGIAYWGDFKAGIGQDKSLGRRVRRRFRGRGYQKSSGPAALQIDFWDPENGYYLNSTYYGDKNLLAIGGATASAGRQDGHDTVDFLMEKKVLNGGAFTIESEYSRLQQARWI